MALRPFKGRWQYIGGVVGYLLACHAQRFASTSVVAPMFKAFVAAIDRFAWEQCLDVVHFENRSARTR